jgi:dTDP-4-dehydrorhamnose 3,5-epimerase-like enzyme
MMAAKIVHLPKIEDPRGNLTFIEELKHLPFEIARAYWIYDVPAGETRGSHAFLQQHEAIMVISGSVDVVTHDGSNETNFTLNRSNKALYLPAMTWRRLENFSTNSVCLVLSSHPYSPADYIREYPVFLAASRTEQPLPLKIRGPVKTMELAKLPSVYDAALIELPRIGQRNGHLSIIEGIANLPFDIARAFYLYDIPAGADRGAHAHKRCHQFLIAATGSFDVVLDDGRNKRTVTLDRPFYGLHIPPGIWAAEQSFSGGSVCLVFTSQIYTESDYIRDYPSYELFRNGQ